MPTIHHHHIQDDRALPLSATNQAERNHVTFKKGAFKAKNHLRRIRRKEKFKVNSICKLSAKVKYDFG